jgi:phage shock protein E
MSFFTKLFQTTRAPDYKALVQSGAQVIDVRSADEFRSGHIRKAINIPLPQLHKHFNSIDQQKPVIVYCASGNRSAAAKQLLQANGFTSVYNGGGFVSLQNKLA